MELSTVHKLYDALAGTHWGFLYSGEFHDEHSARLIDLAEEASKTATDSDPPLTKKLAFVMVEAYQNILRHRAPLDSVAQRAGARSLFMVRSDARSYDVAAMNPMRKDESGKLVTLLEQIRKNSDLKQLKEMFLRGLQSDQQSQRGGAGLGLIEMARRSSNGLHHDIRVVEGDQQMFTLQLRVGTSSLATSTFEEIYDIQRAMASMDALLVFKGAFTAAFQSAFMRMITTDLDDQAGGAQDRTKAFLATMELIGEVRDQTADPIIMIGRAEGHYSLVTGLVLEPRIAERLLVQTHVLRDMDPSAIQRIYRDSLLGRNTDGAFTSTGMLDLARRSRSPMESELFPQGKDRLLLIRTLI